jgi:hypothetical protein
MKVSKITEATKKSMELIEAVSQLGLSIKSIQLSNIGPNTTKITLDLSFYQPDPVSQNNDQTQTEHIYQQ